MRLRKVSLLAGVILVLLPGLASARTLYLTSGTSWTVPADWNSSNNTIQVIGGGGGGSSGIAYSTGGDGGGGGAYSEIVDLALTPNSSVTYQVGAGGAGGGSTSGSAGGNTFFNGGNCPSSSICAKGGGAGTVVNYGVSPGAGGAASGVGTTRYAGGGGGGDSDPYDSTSGSGGGGAAGPYGAGIAGSPVISEGAAGGAGDAGYGGAGGAGGWLYQNGSAGGNGAEWSNNTGPAGAGGGGGGPWSGGTAAGPGGYYGGGGSGGTFQAAGGSGAPGIIVITWVPIPPTCAVSFAQNPINQGSGTTMYWSSTHADNVYINNYGWAGTSGSVVVAPSVTTDYSCYGESTSYGNGAETAASLTVNPAPTCSVSISPNPSAYAYSGTPVTLSWGSSNASNVYVNSIGWVGTSGSTQVASQASTNYSCYAYSAAYGDSGWVPATLTVNPPPAPAINLSVSSSSIQTGQSSIISATYAAGSGDALTYTDIEEPLNNALKSGSPASSLSYTFTPSTAGTYTFYARATSDYSSSWSGYPSATVTVITPAPNCSLSASPSSITQGNSTTLSWSCTNATSCTGTNFQTGGATSGSTSVSPTQTTTYTGSCTGPGGTSNFNAEQVPVTCNQSWSCSGQTIVQTNTDCSQTQLATCSSPQYCQAGSDECLYPAIMVIPSGNSTGNLQLTPSIVKSAESVQVAWDVQNAQSCTVSGTNKDGTSQSTDTYSPGVWSTESGSETSSLITGATTYTLSCSAYPGNPNLIQTQTVELAPLYQEK